MQTFLPYKDFRKSLECLDFRRLGKQRVESSQILDCLLGKKSGWKNHPAVKMWSKSLSALTSYYNLSLDVFAERGGRNIILKHKDINDLIVMPCWLTDEFCSAHRSNLLRKDEKIYRKYGWTELADKPYIWPISGI